MNLNACQVIYGCITHRPVLILELLCLFVHCLLMLILLFHSRMKKQWRKYDQ